MKSVSVRELRQNPAGMLRDVEAGETYAITSRNRQIARIEPIVASTQVIPAKREGRPQLAERSPHTVRTAASVDELLDDLKGDW
ncbi:type II toxin-antitoxin system prevent-host-death family antitoxin [Microbacterium protaetiae]|uniref:Type II toxin-antitoxin system prevent-host-death family antitoxin n=1 Tax=Microbacterium protaetiae TaxID=2509458 RepID=A0A4P6EFY6_9MICO|nr:type II toxin-antitoxin system prevent-host-death family antitoxin [Microbacterium protaetiae]QAY61205.1 type II toxin-antitoxin system prevent-host-death family antitoxin [Microbacterium protaetiae]